MGAVVFSERSPRRFTFPARALASLALLVGAAHAQLTQTWERVAPVAWSNLDTHARSLVRPDGSIVVAGNRVNPAPGITRDGVLAAYGADGTLLWTRPYVPSGVSDSIGDIALDAATGDLVVVGSTRPVGSGNNLRLSRFDSAGNLLWTAVFVQVLGDGDGRVCIDSSGSIWVAGRSLASPPSAATPFLRSFTPAGVPLATVATPPNGVDAWVRPHPGGGIAYLLAVGTPPISMRILRVDAAGNVVWSRTLPSHVPHPGLRRLECDAAGNVYVCGTTLAGQALIQKLDASGNVIWTRAYDDGSQFELRLTALAVDALSNIVAVGFASDLGNYAMYTFAMRCDASGNVTWSHQGNPYGHNIDFDHDVQVDAAGGAIVAGSVVEPPSTMVNDAILLRYDRDGTLRASVHLAAPGQDSSYSQVYALSNGDYLVSGVDGGLVVARYHEQGVPFCLGDGSASACPCGNTSPTYDQSGCRYNASGASRLVDRGVARISADSAVLELRGAPPTGPVMFVQGDQRQSGGAGAVFGDGLLCVGGNLTRLGTVNASGGVARLGAAGTPHVSTLGHVAAPGVFAYQALHRSSASFCTPAATGTSNGLEITWSP